MLSLFKVKKFLKSFHYALEGIIYSFTHDQNLLIHFFAALLVMLVSLLLHLKGFEMGLIGITILLVIAAEMINSAIEKMVDLITIEHRREAKIAKDVSAGMVLFIAAGSAIIGILVFLPHIIQLFFTK